MEPGEQDEGRADHARVPALLETAIWDRGGEAVEGGLVDHWISNASKACSALSAIFTRDGFSPADADALRGAMGDVPDGVRDLLEDLGRSHEAVRSFVRRMLDDPEPRVRTAALRAGARLFDPVFLLRFLNDADRGVRVAAVNTLAEPLVSRRVPEAQPHLSTFLDDKNVHVRIAAVKAIQVLDNPAGVEALARRMETERDAQVRNLILMRVAEAVEAEGRLGQLSRIQPIKDPARRILLRGEEHEYPEVRTAVVKALRRVGGRVVIASGNPPAPSSPPVPAPVVRPVSLGAATSAPPEEITADPSTARHLACGTCSPLRNQERAVQHVHPDPKDTHLPEAARKLVTVRDISSGRPGLRLHQCPECRTYYLYRAATEFLYGGEGSLDEQSLTRLSHKEAARYLEGASGLGGG